ncbi:MAG TPA: PHB depolymerase family esterase [Burkholderiaceae bacterium]|nr:PHB depolymerase family esterase [Burkholderiaceae bacterium]
MPSRRRRSPWSGLLQRSVRRSLSAFQRSTKRAVAQANRLAKKTVTKPARPRRAPRRPASAWLDAVARGAGGARRYLLYRPAGASATPLPLLVLLHGCAQDAAGIARSTRIERVAARAGFIVLCPQQERLANPHGCWNWFGGRSGRALAEAASIVGAVDDACARHGADPARVAVAGLSAGASMAALLALHHPQRFAAVAMHSGVAPGAARSSAGALGAMQGRRRAPPLGEQAIALPPLLVIQGTADAVVNVRNGRTAAQLWADAAGAISRPPRSVQRGTRLVATLTDYRRGPRLVATLCEIAGLGHGWSGGAPGQPHSDARGPDAARMIWTFAARCFARLDQSAAKQ